MTRPAILGLGPVCALGAGTVALIEGLEGRCQPLVEDRQVGIAKGPVPLKIYTSKTAGLERFAPRASLRRTEPFAQQALLAAYLAFEDAGLVPGQMNQSRVAVVFGSAWGCLKAGFAFQDSSIAHGDICSSPTHFSSSTHNAPASQVSIALGLAGPAMTLSCFEQTFGAALQAARNLLDNGSADYVLVGVGDEICPVTEYALAQRRGPAPDLDPLAFDKCTWALGGGFCCLLLGRGSQSPKYGYLEEIFMGTRVEDAPLKSLDAVFLAANGDSATGSAYRTAALASKRSFANANLFGSFPTANALDLAVACLCLREGRLLAPGDPQASRPSRLGCLQIDTYGSVQLFIVSNTSN
jgi:hypothetical protein